VIAALCFAVALPALAQSTVTVSDPIVITSLGTIGKLMPITVMATMAYTNEVPPPPPHDHTAVLMFYTQPSGMGQFGTEDCSNYMSRLIQCTIEFTPSSAGVYSFCARYPGSQYFAAGDTRFPAANNPSCPFIVNYALTITKVDPRPKLSVDGQSVEITARVNEGYLPTGKVKFNLEDRAKTSLCPEAELSKRTAVCTTSLSKIGDSKIVATYLGDANNVSTRSEPVTLEVKTTEPSGARSSAQEQQR